MSGRAAAQVVVVAGASGGVGRAVAHAFAKRGAHVALLAHGERGLEGARREVESFGGMALTLPTDVADSQQVETAADAAEERFGPIDVWVNDAMATVAYRAIPLQSAFCGTKFAIRGFTGSVRTELILADGFSCREQVRQQTDRQALHLAQVLQEGRARGVEHV